MGHLFHRTRRDKNGRKKTYSTWTYKFYHNGKQRYFNTGETNKRKARDKAIAYEAEVKKGDTPWDYAKTTFEDLKEMIRLDYSTNKLKSSERLTYSLKALSSHFDGIKAKSVTTHQIKVYIKKRQTAGRSNGTINRELSALKRMFSLAMKETPPRVAQIPHIPMLKESKPREGFFEHKDYLKIMRAAPMYLKGVIGLAYRSGIREEEALSIEWKQIDFNEKMIRLDDTKSDEPRNVPFDDQMSWLLRQFYVVRSNLPKKERSKYVFLNRDSKDRINDFRGAWNTACREAGLGYGYKVSSKYVEEWEDKLPEGPIFHDLRRTAVRNMVRAGIPEKVAMAISGHKTRSVFDRYNIVDEKDTKKAVDQLNGYLKEKSAEVKKTSKKVVPMRKPKSTKVKAKTKIKTV